MKKFLILASLVLMFLVSLSSCGSDKTTAPSTDNPQSITREECLETEWVNFTVSTMTDNYGVHVNWGLVNSGNHSIKVGVYESPSFTTVTLFTATKDTIAIYEWQDSVWSVINGRSDYRLEFGDTLRHQQVIPIPKNFKNIKEGVVGVMTNFTLVDNNPIKLMGIYNEVPWSRP